MIYNKWSTPIMHGNFEVEGLAEHILANYNMQEPPSDFDYNILEGESTYIQELKFIAENNFRQYVKKCFGVDMDRYESHLKGWITGHGDNYSMAMHNHSGAQFSAVYYVMAEEQNQGGKIYFMDPRSNANRGYDNFFQHHFKPFELMPKSGDFVIFPSFVYHYVAQFHSRFRIAIPIDLYLYEE